MLPTNSHHIICLTKYVMKYLDIYLFDDVRLLQNTATWPLIAPLPSYGRGRERPGGRYMSFIHGEGLHDVIITGM